MQRKVAKLDTTLVFGGSGFIGSHLLRRLAARGGRAISVDLRPPTQPIAGVGYIQADVRNLTALAIEGPVERIFNLAAVHTTPGHKPWEYYACNVGGATEVLAFARRKQTRSIHFTSTMSVYEPGEQEKTEQSEPSPVSDYGRSKLAAEALHRAWLKETPGRKLVISRPAAVFGPGENGNFTRLARLLSKGWFIYPGRKNTIKSCIYVGDLVDWILHADAMEDRDVLFNAAFADRYTLEQIVDAFQATAFPSVRKFVVPAVALRMAARTLRPLSQASALGLHPERVSKLMHSTNIVPTWAQAQGLPSCGLLETRLRDWLAASGGTTFA